MHVHHYVLQVYIEQLSPADLLVIVSTVHSTIPRNLLEKMISFTQKVHPQSHSVNVRASPCGNVILQVSDTFRAGLGSDIWEFNLRDIFRWCELMTKHQVSLYDQ